ncbi:hypothetical protein [Gallibacterium anatis]|uniref:hypothetical protein n=1 Tax=Gallibacterium anatis TaxID=750 RepID=UPI00053110AF|nr:hypothetical protein [Gallibacterium anatis]KGQ68715.1 hypothetical protein IO47_03665 [Gallibacterium anatis]OZN48445.1 hypothetical protein CF595_10310 [Gallibacterium anatis]
MKKYSKQVDYLFTEVIGFWLYIIAWLMIPVLIVFAIGGIEWLFSPENGSARMVVLKSLLVGLVVGGGGTALLYWYLKPKNSR